MTNQVLFAERDLGSSFSLQALRQVPLGKRDLQRD